MQQTDKNNNRPVLVLDLDGTLVDSRGDLVNALNVAIASVGLSAIPVDDIGEVAGKGARAMISRAHEIHQQPLSEQQMDGLVKLFLEYYQNNISKISTPYPGVLNALDVFLENDWLLAVCTNKFEYLAKKLLGELNMAHQFTAICGSDTFKYRKPDGRHVSETVALCGGEQSISIMVGDTPTDINAARDAGIRSIAVDFGYHDQPEDILKADRIISHFDELWPVAIDLNRG